MLINVLRLPDGSFVMWKFACDTTVSGIVMKFLRNLVENVTLRKMVDPQEALHLVSKSPSSKVSNRPFPSSLVPLFQNESKCETFPMKMTLICMKINLQAELIFR